MLCSAITIYSTYKMYVFLELHATDNNFLWNGTVAVFYISPKRFCLV